MALTRVTPALVDIAASATAGQIMIAMTDGSLAGINQANLAVGGANITGTVASATVAASANTVTGENVTGTVASATLAATVTTNAQPNITSVGTLASLTTTGDVLVGGNLTINGITTTVHSTEIVLDDKNITLANAATSAAQANGGGITLNGAAATMLYNSADDTWNFNKQIVGNLTGTAAVANLATSATTANSVAGANVSGTVANATYATTSGSADSVTVANVSGIGNIATVSLRGNGSQTLLGNGGWGTLSSSLASLSDVAIANVTSGQFLKYNGTGWVNSSTVDGGTA